MKYIAYTFTAQPEVLATELGLETVYDLLSAELGVVGFDSFEQQGSALLAYVPAELANEQRIAEALAEMPFAGLSYHYETESVPEVNWNEEWERNYFSPIVLGDGLCVVRAPFHTNYPEARTEVIIQPKMAFGTGNHETTALMIAYLLERELTGQEVLDMGAGSGILGILALKCGAKCLTAIDIDEWAYQNILENATLNGVEVACAMQGDARDLAGRGPFDLVLANITRNVLLEDMPEYVRVLKSGGRLVLSGFYEEDVPSLLERAQGLGLTFLTKKVRNNWTLLEFG